MHHQIGLSAAKASVMISNLAKAESRWLLLGTVNMHCGEVEHANLNVQPQEDAAVETFQCSVQAGSLLGCVGAHQAAHSCVLYGSEPAHKAVQSIPRAAWQDMQY